MGEADPSPINIPLNGLITDSGVPLVSSSGDIFIYQQ